jgi:hypothetical protein
MHTRNYEGGHSAWSHTRTETQKNTDTDKDRNKETQKHRKIEEETVSLSENRQRKRHVFTYMCGTLPYSIKSMKSKTQQQIDYYIPLPSEPKKSYRGV